MKFFNLDMHISVIEDIKHIFHDLGHQVDSVCMSGHSWVFGRERESLPPITHENWYKAILNHDSLFDEFYNRYKEMFSEYDAFIITYPACFAILFEVFNKPIYVVGCVRAHHPNWDNADLLTFTQEKLAEMVKSGQIITIANSKYDSAYYGTYIGGNWKHIPNICEYTGAKYKPTVDEFVMSTGSRSYYAPEGSVHISSLGQYSWQDLYSHKAIAHIPYNVSIMSIFEQYTANIPLFFPTIEHGSHLQSLGYMSDLLGSTKYILNAEQFYKKEMLELADFYDQEWMPHITYYDNIDELNSLVNSKDLCDISNNMEKFNQEKKENVYSLWEDTINAGSN
tara:strand:- start:4256 stop:5269 length:1014 start_codon:yes stop_codon:yes gene_type:complete